MRIRHAAVAATSCVIILLSGLIDLQSKAQLRAATRYDRCVAQYEAAARNTGENPHTTADMIAEDCPEATDAALDAVDVAVIQATADSIRVRAFYDSVSEGN